MLMMRGVTATTLPLLPDPDTWLDVPCARDPDAWVDVTDAAQAERAAAACRAGCPLLDACRRYAEVAPPWGVPVVLAGELHEPPEPQRKKGAGPPVRTGGLYGVLWCENPAAHAFPVQMNRRGDRYRCPACRRYVKGVEAILPSVVPDRVYVRPGKGRGGRSLDELRARCRFEF